MQVRSRTRCAVAVPIAGIVFGLALAPGVAQTVQHASAPRPASSVQPLRSFAVASVRYRRAQGNTRTADAGTLLLSAPYNGSFTVANRYLFGGGACITAGDASTPSTSIPACGARAPHDANWAGALQLTPPEQHQNGFVVLTQNPIFSTAAGLIVTFTDYSFGGSRPGADGITAFLADASAPPPKVGGQSGGSLGYANAIGGGGLTNAYIGIGLDEYGNFSNPTEGRSGGPGLIPETVAVRGAAATGWQYLTGAKNAGGAAASLPFTFDRPAAAARVANALTVQITLTPQGVLSVAIDLHDGSGFVDDIPPTNIVGLNGQPAVPANVYLGFAGSTGGSTSRHQIGALTVTTIAGHSTSPPPPSAQDNLTYHNNNARTGWYAHETTLTAANVGSHAFHLIGSMATAGKSYSQPLFLSGQTLSNGSTHNVVIVTDSTDAIYAYDADNLGLLWKRDFKGIGVRQQYASDIGCDDTWPSIGINGTPVVDRARNTLYVVVPTNENGVAHLRLHAVSVTSGADAVAPVEVAASVALASGGIASVDPSYNYDRAALLETNNTIYVPLSDHCDFNADRTHGWLLAYNADTLAQTAAAVDMTNKDQGTADGARFLGSIWQGGFGVAADAQSNIFFATGNGPNDNGSSNFAMSVLKLPPSLNVGQRQFFTPSTWLSESQTDTDLGSGGVMLLPDQNAGAHAHLAVTGGKDGVKYILDRDNLGGLNPTDRVLFEGNTAGGIFGGPAYFVDATGAQKILYGGSPNLNAYTLVTAPYGLALTSATNVGSLENRNSGITPIVSSNGTVPGTAVVWGIKTPPGTNNGAGTISLYAFNGANLSNALFAAAAGQWIGNGDTGGAMITPLVANGRVYLATDGVVTVFGIH